MSLRRFINNSGTFALLALVVVCTAVPTCFAGGAVTIVPDKNQLAPKGSYIPDRRVKEVLKKVEEHKAMVKQRKSIQEKKSPKP